LRSGDIFYGKEGFRSLLQKCHRLARWYFMTGAANGSALKACFRLPSGHRFVKVKFCLTAHFWRFSEDSAPALDFEDTFC